MTKSRLSLVFLMMGLALVGCKKLRGLSGKNVSVDPSASAMPSSSAANAMASAMASAMATAMASAGTTDTTGADTSGGGSCPKAVKCCKILSGDTNAACDSLTKAPELTCATTLTSYRKAVKATKPKRLSECD